MTFLESTYSGVTWAQLFVPWIFLIIFAGLAIWGWAEAISQKNTAYVWEQCENITHRRLNDSLEIKQAHLDTERNMVKILQDKLDRVTVRPRNKDGRFKKP